MTRARALKQVIRARAARTGERYTTARRHVLASMASTPTPAPLPERSASTRLPRTPAAKGAVSDDKVRERTGHGLDHWFAVLDRFGGVEKGHTASARHLFEAHKVPGWYAQGITVAYERARGVRVLNQRCDGEYEVSVSKVLPAGTAEAIQALTDTRVRRRWTEGVDPQLTRALFASLDGPASRGVVVRADGLGRHRYKWGSTTVQLYLVPKAGGKLSLVATNSKLADGSMVEERRAMWRTTLDALARSFSGRRI
jgi:hypothetical protein